MYDESIKSIKQRRRALIVEGTVLVLAIAACAGLLVFHGTKQEPIKQPEITTWHQGGKEVVHPGDNGETARSERQKCGGESC